VRASVDVQRLSDDRVNFFIHRHPSSSLISAASAVLRLTARLDMISLWCGCDFSQVLNP